MANDGAADAPATGSDDESPTVWTTANDELKFANAVRVSVGAQRSEIILSFGNFVPPFDDELTVVHTIAHVVVAPDFVRGILKEAVEHLDEGDEPSA